jgi:hypothetical protein
VTHRSSRHRTTARTKPRLFLGGLLTSAVTTLVLAVPVVSGAGEAEAPVVAAKKPSSSASSSSSSSLPATAARPRGDSPVIMGLDGLPMAEAPAAAAPPAATASSSSSGAAAPAPRSVPVGDLGECAGSARTAAAGPVPAAGTVLSSEWKVSEPAPDATFDLSGVVSTAFPSTQHPFVTGVGTPGERTCIVGGELRGTIDPARSWEWFHDEANAACVKVVAVEWLQIHNTRCDGVEDGFRPQEGGVNLNRTQFLIQGTYLTNVADDCLENDYTLGGVLRDNLWESCFTGISERPSSNNGTWTSPADETLTLDHMLIGLRSMPHDSDKGTGPNALFKWSSSANKVVIRCSTFFVPERSVNNTDTMAIPAGTVVDDSACPDNPSTIVWLGGGAYPADTAGIRVVSDPAVWTDAVQAWKAAHGY